MSHFTLCIKNRFKWSSILGGILLFGVERLGFSAPSEGTYVLQPCTPSEHWHWADSGLRDSHWAKDFERSLTSQGSKAQGFSEALALRKLAATSLERAFGEYWMSRILLDVGMVHLAERGFRALFLNEVSNSTSPFQWAAVGCLSRIHREFSAISVPPQAEAIRRLSELNSGLPEEGTESGILKPILWEMALYEGIEGAKDRRTLSELLKNSGPFEAFYQAALSLEQGRFSDAIGAFKLFFGSSQKYDLFRPFYDRAYLLFGRALYSEGQYREAIAQFQKVGIRSNERVHALSDLSWASLMAEQYREAIGMGIGLQSGAFRQSFAPESMMVMAMALNEMCQFPESIQVIQSFRRNYRSAYFWLKEHLKRENQNPSDFYKLAVQFTKRSPDVQVPPRVASEWIRSPIFLANQERINLIYREKSRAEELERQGKLAQRSMRTRLLMDVRNLGRQFKLAKVRMKPGDVLAPEWFERLHGLKREWIHYQRLKSAAPIWKKMLNRYLAMASQTQSLMVTQIHHEISELNREMLTQLDEISENNELIEVEIFNGASEDIVWQNAHPGYKEAEKRMDRSSNENAVEKVWNWGTVQGGLEGQSEIWEDEIGALSANISNHCENKDKYLSIEKIRNHEGR